MSVLKEKFSLDYLLVGLKLVFVVKFFLNFGYVSVVLTLCFFDAYPIEGC